MAKEVTKEVQDKYLKNKPIVTQILPIGKWWAGEEYHQNYCKFRFPTLLSSFQNDMSRIEADVTVDNNPGGYECPTHQFYW